VTSTDAAAPRSDRTPGALIRAAAEGDHHAWDELVDKFAALVWYVARSHRLGPADAADVSQTTWLRLVEHLDRLREPEQVAAWLATTARHECLRLLRRTNRELPQDTLDLEMRTTDMMPSPESVVLAQDDRAQLWSTVDQLPIRCRTLLRILAARPDASYTEISAALGMPVGSIGPTRARCLERLRRDLAAAEATGQDPQSQPANGTSASLPGQTRNRQPAHGRCPDA
jgi:RNA polymerase sigma factor (sigma-70 family)